MSVSRFRKRLSHRQAQKKQVYKDLLKLVGSAHSGPADVSVNHDKYLGEALYEDLKRAGHGDRL